MRAIALAFILAAAAACSAQGFQCFEDEAQSSSATEVVPVLEAPPTPAKHERWYARLIHHAPLADLYCAQTALNTTGTLVTQWDILHDGKRHAHIQPNEKAFVMASLPDGACAGKLIADAVSAVRRRRKRKAKR